MKAVSINITAQDANAASDPQVKEFLMALSDRVSGMIKKNTLERIELSMLVNGSVMTKTTFDGQDVSVEVIE